MYEGLLVKCCECGDEMKLFKCDDCLNVLNGNVERKLIIRSIWWICRLG